MFFVSQVQVNFRISQSSKILTNLSLKTCGFSPFNQILLNLFDVSSTFHDNI